MLIREFWNHSRRQKLCKKISYWDKPLSNYSICRDFDVTSELPPWVMDKIRALRMGTTPKKAADEKQRFIAESLKVKQLRLCRRKKCTDFIQQPYVNVFFRPGDYGWKPNPMVKLVPGLRAHFMSNVGVVLYSNHNTLMLKATAYIVSVIGNDEKGKKFV